MSLNSLIADAGEILFMKREAGSARPILSNLSGQTLRCLH
jgi:hypothetical protein